METIDTLLIARKPISPNSDGNFVNALNMTAPTLSPHWLSVLPRRQWAECLDHEYPGSRARIRDKRNHTGEGKLPGGKCNLIYADTL